MADRRAGLTDLHAPSSPAAALLAACRRRYALGTRPSSATAHQDGARLPVHPCAVERGVTPFAALDQQRRLSLHRRRPAGLMCPSRTESANSSRSFHLPRSVGLDPDVEVKVACGKARGGASDRRLEVDVPAGKAHARPIEAIDRVPRPHRRQPQHVQLCQRCGRGGSPRNPHSRPAGASPAVPTADEERDEIMPIAPPGSGENAQRTRPVSAPALKRDQRSALHRAIVAGLGDPPPTRWSRRTPRQSGRSERAGR